MESSAHCPGEIAVQRLTHPLWKRALDLLCIAGFLPILIPLAGLISAWVKLLSKGPVFYRQERVGLNGSCFKMLKFRSMELNACTSSHEQHVEELLRSGRPLTKLDKLGDRRLVPGGTILRSTGLDELPQLINVLRGEMSLVGPRPCLPVEYQHCDSGQLKRFDVLPGITGYWQVNGKNRTTFEEMLELDAHYVGRRSLRLDLVILAKTPFVLLGECVSSLRRDKPRSADS